jgi:hypothetical protein
MFMRFVASNASIRINASNCLYLTSRTPSLHLQHAMSDKPQIRGGRGVVVSSDDRDTLYALVCRLGERQTLQQLGIGRQTLARILGGLPVHRMTWTHVRCYLYQSQRS